MGTVFHVLQEEYERLQEAEQLYLRKIGDLPRGKPRIKNIRGSEYLYLNRREGTRVVDEYIGKVGSDKARETLDLVEKRNRYSKLLKEVREQIRELKKVLRGKI